jgi:hypothetical protein
VAGLRLLVLDAYAPEGRVALCAAGGAEAGALYARLLTQLDPEARVEIAHPADPDPDLPGSSDLAWRARSDSRVPPTAPAWRASAAAGPPSSRRRRPADAAREARVAASSESHVR